MVSFLNRFRKGSTDYPTFEETNNPNTIEYPPMPPVTPPKETDPCYYTVGRTINGSTVLRIQNEDGYNSMTLTMTAPAVKQLIRILEATLDEEELNESE